MRRATRTLGRCSVLGTLAGALLSACGPTAFQSPFQETEPEISLVLAELEAVEHEPQRSVAVVVRTAPSALRAVELSDGGQIWEVETTAASTPVVAGGFVVTAEDEGAVRVRRLTDGRVVADLGSRGRLLGANGDSSRVVVSLAHGGEQSPRGELVLVNESGTVWSHELTLGVGVAAVADDVVVVPWATQRVSFLDAADGHERARVRFAGHVVGRVWVEGDRVLLGQHEVWSAGASMAEPDRVETWQPAGRPLPAQPPLLADGYAQVPAPAAAENRVRLEWRVGADARSASDGLLYFVFYRLVFALEADRDEVRWVHVRPRDVVGARAIAGGLWLVDDAGNMTALAAADGRPLVERALGVPIVAAAIRPAAPISAEGTPEGAPADAMPSLTEQLLAAARLDDNRLAGGRGLAARYLGQTDAGAPVTGHLVSLCADRRAPEPARVAACDALVGRTEGAQHVRAALSGHASFLTDSPPPPAGPLSRAAASMRLNAAVPLLLRHLEDPSTPAGELPDLIRGLGDLGVASAAPRIEAFVRLYHASDDALLQRAVVAGVQALATLRRRDTAEWITELETDPFTPPAVLAQLRAADAAAQRETQARAQAEARTEARAQATARTEARAQVGAQAAQAGAQANAQARAQARAPEPAATPDNRPERLSAEITRAVFRPAQRALAQCLTEEATTVRVSMVVAGDGVIGAIAIHPASTRECVEPIVRGLAFPETRAAIREQVVHTIRR